MSYLRIIHPLFPYLFFVGYFFLHSLLKFLPSPCSFSSCFPDWKNHRKNPIYFDSNPKFINPLKMLFLLLVVVVFVFELFVVALAVAAWMINQRLDQHAFSIQSTENQKKAQVLEPPLSNGNEEFYIPGNVQGDGQSPCLNGSLVPERARIRDKHNLRKSLDWDTAFLTSPGLLDPEEFSCLINGAEQGGKQMLTGFQNDVWRFTDSISTLGSDSLILENFEAEFFEDIQTSIQKFNQNAFAAASETCQATSDESQAISSKWKMNISSQNQKQQPALKKPIGLSKSLSNQAVRRLGTMRGVEQEARTEQPVDRPGDSNLTLLNSPRVINKDKSTPTITAKRASVAVNRAYKIKHNKTTVCSVAGKRPRSSKKPVATGTGKVLTKPLSPSKAYFDSSTASSLTDISGSVFSDELYKSHLPPIQTNFGDRNVKTPPPVKHSRIMATPGNAAVAANLMSSEISSSISPDSSISKWSSSPSPSSTTSMDATSCSSLGYDMVVSGFNEHCNSQILKEDNFSLENDDLFLESFERSLSNETEEGLVPCGDEDDQFSYLNKYLETGRATGKGLCSLRNSLDWHSAFFTSDGLLDPEELSCLFNGACQYLQTFQHHFF